MVGIVTNLFMKKMYASAYSLIIVENNNTEEKEEKENHLGVIHDKGEIAYKITFGCDLKTKSGP